MDLDTCERNHYERKLKILRDKYEATSDSLRERQEEELCQINDRYDTSRNILWLEYVAETNGLNADYQR
jgi:hypothetical protein